MQRKVSYMFAYISYICQTPFKVFSPLFHCYYCLIIPFNYVLPSKETGYRSWVSVSSLRKPTFKILIRIWLTHRVHFLWFSRVPTVTEKTTSEYRKNFEVDFIDYWCAAFLEEQPIRFFYYNKRSATILKRHFGWIFSRFETIYCNVHLYICTFETFRRLPTK